MAVLDAIPADIWGRISEYCPETFYKLGQLHKAHRMFINKAFVLFAHKALPEHLAESTALRKITFMDIRMASLSLGALPETLHELIVQSGTRKYLMGLDAKKFQGNLPRNLKILDAEYLRVPKDEIQKFPIGIQSAKVSLSKMFYLEITGIPSDAPPYVEADNRQVHGPLFDNPLRLGGVKISAKSKLPESITSLSCSYGGTDNAATFPRGLTYLNLSHSTSCLHGRSIPNELLATFPAGLKSLYLSPLPRLESVIDKLPKNLTEMSATCDDFELLPRGLKILELARTSRIDAAAAGHLPRGLTELKIAGSHHFDMETLEAFPALETLNVFAHCTFPYKSPDNLRSITSLTLSAVDSYSFIQSLTALKRLVLRKQDLHSVNIMDSLNYLPTSLTTLIINGGDLSLSGALMLPRGLTYLEVRNFDVVSKKMRRALPRGLLYLETLSHKYLKGPGMPADVRVWF